MVVCRKGGAAAAVGQRIAAPAAARTPDERLWRRRQQPKARRRPRVRQLSETTAISFASDDELELDLDDNDECPAMPTSCVAVSEAGFGYRWSPPDAVLDTSYSSDDDENGKGCAADPRVSLDAARAVMGSINSAVGRIRRFSRRDSSTFDGDDDENDHLSDTATYHTAQSILRTQDHTPLGGVRIVPAKESSLRRGLSAHDRAVKTSASALSCWRGQSLLISMGCILLAASVCLTSTPHNMTLSALASTYLSLLKNEVRYQAFKLASVQCRDLNAIRSELIGIGNERKDYERQLTGLDHDGMLSKVEKLRREASFVSRQLVEERFGKGPHYVRFTLDISNDNDEHNADFVVKLADASVMPNSVSAFLSQVDVGYWNDKAFDLNAGHVLVASGSSVRSSGTSSASASNDNNDEASAYLKEHGLAAPVFGEYSPLRPHSEFTLGFVANRPSPHFYINTRNNEDVHGQRSNQQHHFADGDADPCFAEVVAGQEHVRRVSEHVPLFKFDAGSRHPRATVRIVSAEVIDTYTPPSLR